MFNYILKRILYFIPTLIFISVIVFLLSKGAGDHLTCADDDRFSQEDCRKEAHEKGYDLPVFYFSISTAAHPDTLHRIFQEERRITLQKLIGQFGNWQEITTYYQALNSLEKAIDSTQTKYRNNTSIAMGRTIEALYKQYKISNIKSRIQSLEAAAQDSFAMSLHPAILTLKDALNDVQQKATPEKLLWPSLQLHGLSNQYHRWVTNFMRGDFGVSNRDGRPVSQKIWDRLPWTLAINIPAIFLAYLIAIPLGVYTALYKDSAFDKRISFVLLLLFSLPGFWIATLLVNLFTTSQYGMKIFPSIGISSLSEDVSFWHRLSDNIAHLLLPIFCVTYGALAFMTRQLRNSMLDTFQQDFVRTARAKGLSENTVVWKHAFRNSIFPLITIFGNVLPSAFAGSIVIELIFNIQGMGYLMWDSIFARDWQVVYTVLMIAALLTVVGILLADLLYAFIDPRVQFGKR